MKVISFDNSFYKQNIKILELNSIEDIYLYLAFAQSKSSKELNRYLSQIKPSHVKLNHALSYAVARLNEIYHYLNGFKIDRTSPEEKQILEIFTNLNHSGYSSLYEKIIKEEFEKNGIVRINSSGGVYLGDIENDWRNTNIKVIEISNVEEAFENENFIIEKDSKFIILENDPEPDSWYKNNVKDTFSAIVNLRDVMEKKYKLEQYLQEFRWATGSKKIFIYTTGNDIDQMEKYIKIGQDLGFEIEILFNDKTLKKKKEELMKKYKISYKFKD